MLRFRYSSSDIGQCGQLNTYKLLHIILPAEPRTWYMVSLSIMQVIECSKQWVRKAVIQSQVRTL
jgi:hypothetical protein